MAAINTHRIQSRNAKKIRKPIPTPNIKEHSPLPNKSISARAGLVNDQQKTMTKPSNRQGLNNACAPPLLWFCLPDLLVGENLVKYPRPAQWEQVSGFVWPLYVTPEPWQMQHVSFSIVLVIYLMGMKRIRNVILQYTWNTSATTTPFMEKNKSLFEDRCCICVKLLSH